MARIAREVETLRRQRVQDPKETAGLHKTPESYRRINLQIGLLKTVYDVSTNISVDSRSREQYTWHCSHGRRTLLLCEHKTSMFFDCQTETFRVKVCCVTISFACRRPFQFDLKSTTSGWDSFVMSWNLAGKGASACVGRTNACSMTLCSQSP